jgi:hypothetical protein
MFLKICSSKQEDNGLKIGLQRFHEFNYSFIYEYDFDLLLFSNIFISILLFQQFC